MAGGIFGPAAAVTPPAQSRQRYAWQEEREHIFSEGAYASEYQADDFMKRLEQAEARDDEIGAFSKSPAAGFRVEQRIFGEDVAPQVPRPSRPAAPPAAPSRLDPASVAAQRDWRTRSSGGFVNSESEEVSPASSTDLQEVAAARARARQQQQRQQQQRQQQHQQQQGYGWDHTAMRMEGMLLQQPQHVQHQHQPHLFPQQEASGQFPPACREYSPRLPIAAQRQQLQSAPGMSSPYPQPPPSAAAPQPSHGLHGQHQWQPPPANRRAGDATFSLFDPAAPCGPAPPGVPGAPPSVQAAPNARPLIVGGVLRRCDSTNNYQTLDRPAGGYSASPGNFGFIPGTCAGPMGRRGGTAPTVDAHASSLNGIL